MVTYQLPLIMSGSTMAGSDTEVQVAIDSDTLKSINWEYFHNRRICITESLPPVIMS